MIIKELIELMSDKGKRFCVDKADMSKVFSWLKQYSEKYAKQPDMEAIYREMAKETGLYIEQTVSGIRVLETLQLIEIEKSDSIDIKIIEHTEKKDLSDAAVFAALQRLR